MNNLPPRGWGYRANGPAVKNPKPPTGPGGGSTQAVMPASADLHERIAAAITKRRMALRPWHLANQALLAECDRDERILTQHRDAPKIRALALVYLDGEATA